MFYLIIAAAAFAAYVVYTHSQVVNDKGTVVREAVIITPKSVGIEALDLAGKASGGAITASKRTISWSAERNALGEASLAASGWQQSKGFMKGYDTAVKATNTFVDTPLFGD